MFRGIFKKIGEHKSGDHIECSAMLHSDGTADVVVKTTEGHLTFSGGAKDVCTKISEQFPSLKKTGIRMLLDETDFRVFPVEMPNVPENSVNDALRWVAKEQSETPIKDLVFSWTSAQVQENNGKRMAFLYCSKRQTIDDRASPLRNAGLPVISVGVPDEAWKTFSGHEKFGNTVAIATIGENSGKLIVIHSGDILMTRRLPFGVNSLASDDGIERTVIDIQRGLDYIDRQYQKISIRNILVAECGEHWEKFTRALSDSINHTVVKLELTPFSKRKSDLGMPHGREMELFGNATFVGNDSKNHVNLAQDIFFRKKELSKDFALLSIAGAGIFSAVLCYAAFFQMTAAKDERQVIQDRLEIKKSANRNAADIKPNAELEKSVAEIEKKVKSLREINDAYLTKNAINGLKFRKMLEALDEKSDAGVKLNVVSMNANGFYIAGDALDQKSMVEWQKSLGKTEGFSGEPIRNFRVDVSGKTIFNFGSEAPKPIRDNGK